MAQTRISGAQHPAAGSHHRQADGTCSALRGRRWGANYHDSQRFHPIPTFPVKGKELLQFCDANTLIRISREGYGRHGSAQQSSATSSGPLATVPRPFWRSARKRWCRKRALAPHRLSHLLLPADGVRGAAHHRSGADLPRPGRGGTDGDRRQAHGSPQARRNLSRRVPSTRSTTAVSRTLLSSFPPLRPATTEARPAHGVNFCA